jgi:hypothetical protein
MSLTASPLAETPYAATIQTVGLDECGYSFRPVGLGSFTCAIDAAQDPGIRHDARRDRAWRPVRAALLPMR